MKTLLLVDDDPFSFKLLEDMYRHEFKIVNDTVTESIEKRLGKDPFDVAIINLSMRGTNTDVAFDLIHSKAPHLPIIVYSSVNQARYARNLVKKGAFWNLTMPLNTDDLTHAMNMAIRMGDVEREKRTTQQDFSQLEEGIAKMSNHLRYELPEKLTFGEDQLTQEIIELLADILQVDKASLMLLNPDSGELRIKAARGLTPYVIQNSVRRLGEGIAGWVAKEGKPLLIKDVKSDPKFSESPFYHQYSTRSLVCVPLKVGERVVGVLSANNKLSGEPFDEKDLYVSTIFSHLLILTLHNAQLQFDREKLHQRETELSTMNRKISTTLEPKVLFHILLNECSTLFESEYVFLFLLEEKGIELIVHYLSQQKLLEARLPTNLIRPWLAYRNGAACITGEPSQKEFEIIRNIINTDVRSWMSSPLILQDRIAGSIELASPEASKFKDEDKVILNRLTQQAALAINNARLYTKLLHSIKEISDARKEVERVRRGEFL